MCFQVQPHHHCSRILSVQYATSGRCSGRTKRGWYNHTTTVAVYCQCYMQQLAAVTRKTYSSRCDHGPVFQKNTNSIFKTPDHSNDKTCSSRCNQATTVAVYCQCYMQHLAAVARKTYSFRCDHGRQSREKLAVLDATTARCCRRNLQYKTQPTPPL